MKLSVLDYAERDQGMTSHDALNATTELAQLADHLGYHRFWVAEHHNVPVFATSAPEVLMAHLASHTDKIRIGSGGVMITNYSTYKVAEIFKMLEALYPQRIDAGIGNSPGGDPVVHEAVIEGRLQNPDYDGQIRQLKGYLAGESPKEYAYKGRRVAPYLDHSPEMYVLGASDSHSKVSGEVGSGFVYAHFIHPDLERGRQAIEDYRKNFAPSKLSQKSHVIIGVFILVGKNDKDAEEMLRAFELWHLSSGSRQRGARQHMQTPEDARQTRYTNEEKQMIEKIHEKIIYGTKEKVVSELKELKEAYQADEILIIPTAYSIEKRKQTISLLAEEIF